MYSLILANKTDVAMAASSEGSLQPMVEIARDGVLNGKVVLLIFLTFNIYVSPTAPFFQTFILFWLTRINM